MSVEVERKFLCTAETLKILDEIGGMCVICLLHIHAWVNLDLRYLTDAVILVHLEMVSEALFQHFMTLIAVVCTVTLLALAICLMLIMKFYYLYQPC